jgi:putative transposase
MSHSYVSNLMHCTFSTKDRYPAIDSELESRLWPYLGGIARENRMKALAIGGTSDHVHALLSLPGMMSFSRAIQLIKAGSSKWIHDTFLDQKKFAWQEGYGAFSVSASQTCLMGVKCSRFALRRTGCPRSFITHLPRSL